jgi:hypothetical protein
MIKFDMYQILLRIDISQFFKILIKIIESLAV